MQQKLDDLCVQMNCNKDLPQEKANLPASKILDHSSRRSSLPGKSDSICSDCWFCDQRQAESIDFSVSIALALLNILWEETIDVQRRATSHKHHHRLNCVFAKL